MPTKKERDAALLDREDPLQLLGLGQAALGLSGTDLADLLGVARKTISRWQGKQSSVSLAHLGQLAVHVHPKDAALAARIHGYATRMNAAYDIPPPPPLPTPAVVLPPAVPPVAPPARPLDTKHRLASVMLAACEAIDMSPRDLRPALLAAFRTAREAGLSVEELELGLSPEAPVKGKKAAAG